MNNIARPTLANIARDRQAVSDLIEQAGTVCKFQGPQRCRCEACPRGDVTHCLDTVSNLASKMLDLLLDHSHREDTLMNSLPTTHAILSHCNEHRVEHTNFTTAYNTMTGKFDARSPGTSATLLKQFVTEWSRAHALKYDAELTALSGATVSDVAPTRSGAAPQASMAAPRLASARSTGQPVVQSTNDPSRVGWYSQSALSTLV